MALWCFTVFLTPERQLHGVSAFYASSSPGLGLFILKDSFRAPDCSGAFGYLCGRRGFRVGSGLLYRLDYIPQGNAQVFRDAPELPTALVLRKDLCKSPRRVNHGAAFPAALCGALYFGPLTVRLIRHYAPLGIPTGDDGDAVF
jgi:hypothetical protein